MVYIVILAPSIPSYRNSTERLAGGCLVLQSKISAELGNFFKVSEPWLRWGQEEWACFILPFLSRPII